MGVAQDGVKAPIKFSQFKPVLAMNPERQTRYAATPAVAFCFGACCFVPARGTGFVAQRKATRARHPATTALPNFAPQRPPQQQTADSRALE